MVTLLKRQQKKGALAVESLTMKEPYCEIQGDDAETRKAAIAREIHRELDAKEEREEENTEIILSMHRRQYSIVEIADILKMPIAKVLSIVKLSN